MTEIIEFPAVYPFLTDFRPKEQALKVLEEAAELIEAVKDPKNQDHAIYEFCDVLQALGNLAKCEYWGHAEIESAYERVYENNVRRGRYEEAENRTEEGQ